MRPSVLAGAVMGLSLALACGAEAPGPTPGPRWVSTAEMNDARMGHSAIVLPSGLVLVSGGTEHLEWIGKPNRFSFLASAELYDPSRGTWTPTGSLATPRWGPTVLLSTGSHAGEAMRVGGASAAVENEAGWLIGQVVATTEYYVPSSGTWVPGPEMLLPSVAAIELTDGKLLAVGSWGSGPVFAPGPEVQLLDPADPQPSWRLVSPMSAGRSDFAMTLLPGGEVLVVGGLEVGSTAPATRDVERYDPVNDRWRKAASLPLPRMWEVLVLLPSGNVLLVGGCGDNFVNCSNPSVPPTMDAWIYEPDNDVWRPTKNPMTYPHAAPSAVVLDSGKVLVAGGNYKRTSKDGGTDYYPSPTPEIFDPDSETWSPTGPMPHYVWGWGAMVKLPTGAVLFTGGSVNGAPDKDEYLGIPAAQLFQ